MAANRAQLQALARQIAQRHRIPPGLFEALVGQESSWNPRAGSNMGAQGLTQLMPATARSLGVTNPWDPAQNLEGGAKYLQAQYQRFHSWPLALAAYNAGPGRVHGAIPAIPETQNYVKRIMANAGNLPGGGGGMPEAIPSMGGGGVGANAPIAPSIPRGAWQYLARVARGAQTGNLPTNFGSTLSGYANMMRGVGQAVGAAAGGAMMGVNSAVEGPLGSTFKLIGLPHQGTHTLGNWQSDDAVDLRVPVGTPVYALEPGVIDPKIGSLGSSNPRFAGQRVTLHGPDNSFYYAHLSRLAVRAGQRVRKGELIGWSGEANGVPHLHLGVERGDPRNYLG